MAPPKPPVTDADFNIGNRYYYGDGVPRDYAKAFEFYKVAAKQGHDKAQFNIGTMYYTGQGVTQDFKKAFEWFMRSGRKRRKNEGNPEAQVIVGEFHYSGKHTPQKFDAALAWFTKAADRGNARALYNLGMYYSREDIRQNLDKAKDWFLKAIEQGHHLSMLELGNVYRIEEDYATARGWYIKACDPKYPTAVQKAAENLLADLEVSLIVDE